MWYLIMDFVPLYYNLPTNRCVLVNFHYFLRVHFINVTVPALDNKAQANETNKESTFYVVRDLDGAARVLANGLLLISRGEAGQM